MTSQAEQVRSRDVLLVSARDGGAAIRELAASHGWTERSCSTMLWRARRRLERSRDAT